MSSLTTRRKAVGASVLASAAMALMPAVAAAHAPSMAYRPPVEYASPGPPRAHWPPRVSRGVAAALPSDRDLDGFEKGLASE